MLFTFMVYLALGLIFHFLPSLYERRKAFLALLGLTYLTWEIHYLDKLYLNLKLDRFLRYVQLTDYHETPIAWPGLSGHVGLRVSFEIKNPFRLQTYFRALAVVNETDVHQWDLRILESAYDPRLRGWPYTAMLDRLYLGIGRNSLLKDNVTDNEKGETISLNLNCPERVSFDLYPSNIHVGGVDEVYIEDGTMSQAPFSFPVFVLFTVPKDYGVELSKKLTDMARARGSLINNPATMNMIHSSLQGGTLQKAGYGKFDDSAAVKWHDSKIRRWRDGCLPNFSVYRKPRLN